MEERVIFDTYMALSETTFKSVKENHACLFNCCNQLNHMQTEAPRNLIGAVYLRI